MIERRIPIQVSEAVERVMAFACQGEVEEIPIEKAYGRYLGEDVISDHDVPPFDRSPYDGFAIHAEDSKKQQGTINLLNLKSLKKLELAM
ncbi:hypothetical protein GCM10020331_007450 [Ectobacillus funiculus]